MKITTDQKDATYCTALFNKQLAEYLDISSGTEQELATKNIVALWEERVVEQDGKTIWSQESYRFLEKDSCP
ncbi:hypothetical protein ACR3AM_005734 [Bacillus thuringiensis]